MLKILDCTLRDGGYYNEWDFPPELVSAYLSAMAEARIDYVELGLRSFPKKGFHGPFAYTTDAFINTLDLPEGPVYGVMVDAKTILASDYGVNEALDLLFEEKSLSKIEFVRVAAQFHEVEHSRPIAKGLQNKGYRVGFNLMQVGGKTDREIAERAAIVAAWDIVEVLYFADSLGNMNESEVGRTVNALRTQWLGELGIHTHNNMSKALSNSLAAKTLGVTWLDSTVCGMGRGAGNAETEKLLAQIQSDTGNRYHPMPVYDLSIRHFEKLRKHYGWGGNLLYFLGAQNCVHPIYIQNLLSNSHYGTDEVIGAIDYLSQLEGTASYSDQVFQAATNVNNSNKAVSGDRRLQNLHQGAEVLVVGSGPSVERYLPSIESYIEQRKPTVIAINTQCKVSDQFIDYFCISHNSKYLSEHENYTELPSPLLMPSHRFEDNELLRVTGGYLAYGLEVSEGKFEIHEEYCVIPADITFAYALAICVHMGAGLVSLVGVDGYESSDIRQLEMLDIIECYKGSNFTVPVCALTPTTYPIDQGSIYAPDI